MTEQFFFDRKEIFRDLNPEQQEAVNCLEGPLLIMAGAGSGKTRVLTCRIANLIAQGISPWNILAITFTNKAANEMKSRAERLIGEAARDVWLSTFHSFCARLLRREIEITGKFTRNFAIYNAADSKSLVKQCVAELDLGDQLFANVHLRISDLKNELIDVEMFKEKAIRSDMYNKNVAIIYEVYQKHLQENNALDFDDLILTTVKLFREHPDVLERYQERFKYISVDEYQDTNVAQYVLTKLLAAKYRNICVVGDADQSIYGWRGADMRNILNFEEDYPNARVVMLEQNYRSTKTILEAANAVIRHNYDRKPKNLWTVNEQGEKIKLLVCRDDNQEAAIVTTEILRLVDSKDVPYRDIALLYRTNAQSQKFEEYFMRTGIPYIIVGGLKFYDRKEIKDIVAYLHVIANPHDSVHLQRIINMPRRGLGFTNLDRLWFFADRIKRSVFEVIANDDLLMQVPDLSPRFRAGVRNFAAMMMDFMELAKTVTIDELIQIVLEDSGYLKMLREMPESGRADAVSREENLGAFINTAKEFLEGDPESTLEEFLNHVALITDLDTVDDKEMRVKLMTVHAAKGLEFPYVFVVGMEDGLFPHANSLYREDDLEEERRACYVALTRAKKKLFITAAKERMFFGNRRNQSVSRFIDEIPPECMDCYGYEPKTSFVPGPPKVTRYTQTYKAPTAHREAKTTTKAKPAKKRVRWKVGDQLNHGMWGLGTVMDVQGEVLVVQFANPEIGLRNIWGKVAPIEKLGG